MFKILNKHKNIFLYLIVGISIIYILMYFMPTTTEFDEDYTFALIKHSYSRIIYFDSMDVHPFLYYYLLKLFLQITTFWTSSLIVKTLLARTFSVVVSLVAFVYLCKILDELHISNRKAIEWVLFILLPGILNPVINEQLTNIRMYALATLFISLEFYNLLKFDRSNNNKCLLLMTVFAILAMYTHYYSAIFAGLLILISFICHLFEHNNNSSLKLLMSGIVYFLSFIPWSPIFLIQLKNPSTYWMTLGEEIKSISVFLVLFIISSIPIIIYYHIKQRRDDELNNSLKYLIIIIVSTFLFAVIYSILKKPMFQWRYMVPILLIYEFIGINILFKLVKLNSHYKIKYLSIIMIIFLILCNIRACIKQFPILKESIQSARICNSWTKSKLNNPIYLHSNIIKNQNNCVDIVSSMSSSNKIFIIPKALKKTFKHNSHMYYDNAYKKLFNNTIIRVHYN